MVYSLIVEESMSQEVKVHGKLVHLGIEFVITGVSHNEISGGSELIIRAVDPMTAEKEQVTRLNSEGLKDDLLDKIRKSIRDGSDGGDMRFGIM